MRGIVGVFPELDATVEAIAELKKLRVGDVTVYSPTPRHELDDVLKHRPSVVRRFTLIGALLGVTFGYWIPIWVSDYWPLVVGGKPIASWVPYTIIGFEVMVLIGSLATVLGLFINARDPAYHADGGLRPALQRRELRHLGGVPTGRAGSGAARVEGEGSGGGAR